MWLDMSNTSRNFNKQEQIETNNLCLRKDPGRYFSANNGYSFPELMTESELIEFLRIPEISTSKDFRNVIENLKRMHDLPRIHICGKPLYPQSAIREWIRNKTVRGK